MLDSLPRFAEQLLSNSANMLPRITTAPPIRADDPHVVTQDPSTLTLAIVGIVTLAVYYAATGWRKPRHDEVRTSQQSGEASVRSRPTDRPETPTRDAA